MITLKRLRAHNFKGLTDVDLTFPDRGSILIEGHNEAGKSTLFEAVYVALYGEPLVGEEGRARQDELIQHGQASASVKLTFLVSQQQFTIERIFEHGKQQQVKLSIQRPDALEETISRVSAVKDRILQELHNLDGESLRNSCFVEQKELGRLETLSRKEREEAIQKLLGLERLTRLGEQFKFRRDQERALELAERRLELAYVQEETRKAIAAEAILAERLDAVHIVTALEQIADLERQQTAAQEQLSVWEQRQQEASERLQRCQTLRDQLHICEQAGQRIADARRARGAMIQAQDELARLDNIERVNLPAARAHLAQVEQAAEALVHVQAAREAVREAEEAVRASKSKLDDLTQAEARASRLAALQAAAREQKNRAIGLKDALAAAEREEQLARQQASRAVARDALENWVRLKEVERRLAEYAAQRAGLLAERQTAEGALATAKSRARMPLVLACGLSVLTLLSLVAGFFWLPALALAAVPLMGSIAVWLWFFKARTVVKTHVDAVQTLDARLQEVEVFRQAAIQTGGNPSALGQYERQLQLVGSKAPNTLEAGRVWLEQLRAVVGPSQETHQLREIAQEKLSVVIRLHEQVHQAGKTTAQAWDALRAEALQDDVAQRLSALSAQAGSQLEAENLVNETAEILALAEQVLLAARQVVVAKGVSNPVGELDAARARLVSTQDGCREQEVTLQQFIRNLNLAGEGDVGPERGRAGMQVEELEKQLAVRPARQEEQQRHSAALTATLVEVRDKLNGVLEVARQIAIEPSQPHHYAFYKVEPAHLTEDGLEVALSEVKRMLEKGMVELDEEGMRAKHDEAIHKQGTLDTLLENLRQDMQETKQAIDAILTQRQFQPPAAYTSSCVGELWALIIEVTSAEQEAIETEHNLASKHLFAARGRERDLAEKIQAIGVQLDIGECQRQVNELREEQAICQQAAALIKDAYDRIARRILPITERNMQPLLQQLTGGRYRDVRLTPDEGDGQADQLDYRIRVWDKSAGRYVAKNLFSGGTRDQCSLALRLAFALATLPQELGVAPGFIFLDEPLSAFDAERAEALVALLTVGTIADHFHQVVLISHHHAFDRAAFQYHVHLEAGQVVASNLPQQEVEAGHAQAHESLASNRVS